VVSPVLVTLSTRTSTGVIDLRNDGSDVTRYQISAFAWSEGANGQMTLEPTQDVVFFPTLLELKPGERRSIRVGTQASSGNLEKSYRLFVEELPGAPSSALSLVVRTRIGIPVFLQPTGRGASANLKIDSAEIVHRVARIHLVNQGQLHTRTQHVTADVLDDGGTALAHLSLDGWYLLPDGQRVYELPLGSACQKARSVKVAVQGVDTPLLVRSFSLSADACGD
jgi:fimbrial chaperone protein